MKQFLKNIEMIGFEEVPGSQKLPYFSFIEYYGFIDVQQNEALWFFVASYVVTDNNKLTKRDVGNDIPH